MDMCLRSVPLTLIVTLPLFFILSFLQTTEAKRVLLLDTHEPRKPETDQQCFETTKSMPPEAFLHPHRFDVFVKIMYADYFLESLHSTCKKDAIPPFVRRAYVEHERAFNNFKEEWKARPDDFVRSFHNTCLSIKEHLFSKRYAPIALTDFPTKDSQPDCLKVWPADAAHRIACANALKLASIPWRLGCTHESCSKWRFKNHIRRMWDFDFFLARGMPKNLADYTFYHFLTTRAGNNVAAIQIYHAQGMYSSENLYQATKQLVFREFRIWYAKQVLLSRKAFQQYMMNIAQQPIHGDNVSAQKTLLVYFIQIESRNTLHRLKKLRNEFYKSGLRIAVESDVDTILHVAQILLFSKSLRMLEILPDYAQCRAFARTVGSNDHHDKFWSLGSSPVLTSEYTLKLFGEEDQSKRRAASDEALWNSLRNPDDFGYCFGVKVLSLTAALSPPQTHDSATG